MTSGVQKTVRKRRSTHSIAEAETARIRPSTHSLAETAAEAWLAWDRTSGLPETLERAVDALAGSFKQITGARK